MKTVTAIIDKIKKEKVTMLFVLYFFIIAVIIEQAFLGED